MLTIALCVVVSIYFFASCTGQTWICCQLLSWKRTSPFVGFLVCARACQWRQFQLCKVNLPGDELGILRHSSLVRTSYLRGKILEGNYSLSLNLSLPGLVSLFVCLLVFQASVLAFKWNYRGFCYELYLAMIISIYCKEKQRSLDHNSLTH